MQENRNNHLNGKKDSYNKQFISNEVEVLRQEVNEYKEKLYRALSDIENQRKRLSKESENERKYAIQDFVTRLLPAKDNLEKGISIAYSDSEIDTQMLVQGMTSALKICFDALNSNGVVEINPLGEIFDPEWHEAMSTRKIEKGQMNVVLKVYQKGYALHGRLLRPACVEISTI